MWASEADSDFDLSVLYVFWGIFAKLRRRRRHQHLADENDRFDERPHPQLPRGGQGPFGEYVIPQYTEVKNNIDSC